ncbi:MAG: bifunctional nuclease family protein [Ardenticatenia bacterium]|nr:bifunctional nuclease family protein [Ardenticatenia bacterium]
MIPVTIDSIRVSLISQHRIVVLKEREGDRHLAIWIGPYEADAITIALQDIRVVRPLTHDLLKNMLETLGATVSYIVVNDLRDDTFYARIVLAVNGQEIEVDSRPSDAIALAVRVDAPIYVAEHVLDQAAIVPEPGQDELTPEEEEKLSVFKDFVESLDLDDFGDE